MTSEEKDPTSDTDRSLLAGADAAQLDRVEPRDGVGASEHPPGRTAASAARAAGDGARLEPRTEERG
jgi:hypothetical protein